MNSDQDVEDTSTYKEQTDPVDVAAWTWLALVLFGGFLGLQHAEMGNIPPVELLLGIGMVGLALASCLSHKLALQLVFWLGSVACAVALIVVTA